MQQSYNKQKLFTKTKLYWISVLRAVCNYTPFTDHVTRGYYSILKLYMESGNGETNRVYMENMLIPV